MHLRGKNQYQESFLILHFETSLALQRLYTKLKQYIHHPSASSRISLGYLVKRM